MKSLIITAISLFSISSFACVEDVCQGDLVIPFTYTDGFAEVTGFGTRSGEITVQRSESRTSETFSLSELAITKGCFNSVCMEQKVIPDSYARGFGFIEGINKYRRTYTIMGDRESTYRRMKYRDLGFTQGCLFGLCTGDRVLPYNYGQGFAIIQAINPSTGFFTVLGNLSTDYHRYVSYNLRVLQANPQFTYLERQRGTFGNRTQADVE